MDKNVLNKIIETHKLWLDTGGVEGTRADLTDADLRGANLTRAILRGANLTDAILRDADLTDADLRGANLTRAILRGADLRGAILRGANLRGADIRGADIDFSTLPLWCGSLDMIVDKRQAAQIAYHLCRFICDDPEVIEMQNKLIPLANQFHRVNECGLIVKKEIKK